MPIFAPDKIDVHMPNGSICTVSLIVNSTVGTVKRQILCAAGS